MTAISSTWMVGGITLAESATIVVGGNDVVVPAGSYYLHDSTDSISLIKTIEDGVVAHYAGSTIRVLQNRKVKFDFNGNSVTLTIPTALQEALGFTGSPYVAATSRTSENVPGLLWSPGWLVTTEGAPFGVAGYKVYDRVVKSSPSGLTTTITTHYSTKRLGVSWFAVRQDRAWTTDELPGEFCDFYGRVIIPGHNMKMYPSVTEDDASTDEVTWPTGLGPYIVPNPPPTWYQRFVAKSDSVGCNISFEMQVTGEY